MMIKCKRIDGKHGSFKLVNKVKKHEMHKCTYYIESGELELRHIFPIFRMLLNDTHMIPKTHYTQNNM